MRRVLIGSFIAVLLGSAWAQDGADADVSRLPEQLQSSDAEKRFEAANMLTYTQPPTREAVPGLVEILSTHAEPKVRAAAAIPALMGLLESGGEQAQGHAATATGKMGLEARQAVPALEKTAQSGPPYARGAAIGAISRIQPELAEKYVPKPAQ